MAGKMKVQDSVENQEEVKTLTDGLPASWAVRLVNSRGTTAKRLHYVHHVDRSAHWIPPPENWTCPNLLPYGWELGIDDDGHIYYINHLTEVTTRRDPRLQTSLDHSGPRKEFLLEKSEDAEGFGLTLSDSPPYTVISVDAGSAASPWLHINDTVSRIGNIEIFELSKEEVSDMLVGAAKTGTVKIQVMNNDTSSMQEAPATDSDGKMATHLLPGVLRVELMTGGARMFRITRTTTVQDIVDNVCKRSEITAPQMFGLYIEKLTSESTTLTTLFGWQLLAKLPQEIIDRMVANEAESNNAEKRVDESLPLTRIVCRLRFLPGSVDDLLEIDRKAFDYFFHQTTHDIANDQFSSECPNDFAMVLGSLNIAHYCIQQGKKKVNLKEVEKSIGGLQPFFPTSILNRLNAGDLRKHVKKALDSQSLDIEQEDIKEIQLKYLALVSEFPSLAGGTFHCADEDAGQDITLLVSPLKGFCSIDSPLEAGWCTEIQITIFCTFDTLESIKVDELDISLEEPLNRVTINFEDGCLEPRRFILGRASARELVHLLQGYATLLAKVDLPLDDPVLLLETKLEADKAPSYRSLHHVVGAPWSYLDMAWENCLSMMKATGPGSSITAGREKSKASVASLNSLSFAIGKTLVDKTTLSHYMAVDLSNRLLYGKRKKKRVIFLRKTGADLARDFLNKPEQPASDEEEDFTAHLSSRQMANSNSETNVGGDGGDDDGDQAAKQAAPKQSSAAAAALAALLSRSTPVVDESQGSATAQPLRGMVASSGNTLISDNTDSGSATNAGDTSWGGSGGGTVDTDATASTATAAAASEAGWGDQDDSQQQSFSDFGVSRKAPQTFGFGDSGGGEEDEIAGW